MPRSDMSHGWFIVRNKQRNGKMAVEVHCEVQLQREIEVPVGHDGDTETQDIEIEVLVTAWVSRPDASVGETGLVVEDLRAWQESDDGSITAIELSDDEIETVSSWVVGMSGL